MADKSTDIRVVLPGATGEFKVNMDTHILVHCADGKTLEVPKEYASKCTFIPTSAGTPEFEFSATVLENLVRWVAQYGMTGVAASPLVRPCLYRDFTFVATDAWDKDYYLTRLSGALNQKHFLSTMTAAEKYGMEGLLDFMSICLGCKLRNEEDKVIVHDIMGVDKDVEVTAEDLERVSQNYPWFDNAIKPVDVK